MRKRLTLCLAIATLCTSLTGCTIQKTSIAYSVYPIGFLIDRLKTDNIQSVSIQQNEIIQRANIKENYKEILDDSAAFFHIGDLEPYLTIYNSDITSSEVKNIDLSTLNAVYDFKRYTQVVTGGEISYIESAYYKGEEFDLVDMNQKDLYLWTDPIAMLSMAKNIRDYLKTTFPDESSVFDDKFKTLEADLTNLDAQYQALASSNENNDKVVRFVTMTASFGNWQKTYGFQVYPIILSKYGALPTDKQLSIIEQRIEEDGVKYIVYEPNMTSDMISLFNKVEEDLNLTRVELSNLSSLTENELNEGKDYLSIMYENLSVLGTMVESRNNSSEITNIPTEEMHDTLD